jgi:HAMP domain-containing protein
MGKRDKNKGKDKKSGAPASAPFDFTSTTGRLKSPKDPLADLLTKNPSGRAAGLGLSPDSAHGYAAGFLSSPANPSSTNLGVLFQIDNPNSLDNLYATGRGQLSVIGQEAKPIHEHWANFRQDWERNVAALMEKRRRLKRDMQGPLMLIDRETNAPATKREREETLLDLLADSREWNHVAVAAQRLKMIGWMLMLSGTLEEGAQLVYEDQTPVPDLKNAAGKKLAPHIRKKDGSLEPFEDELELAIVGYVNRMEDLTAQISTVKNGQTIPGKVNFRTIDEINDLARRMHRIVTQLVTEQGELEAMERQEREAEAARQRERDKRELEYREPLREIVNLIAQDWDAVRKSHQTAEGEQNKAKSVEALRYTINDLYTTAYLAAGGQYASDHPDPAVNTKMDINPAEALAEIANPRLQKLAASAHAAHETFMALENGKANLLQAAAALRTVTAAMEVYDPEFALPDMGLGVREPRPVLGLEKRATPATDGANDIHHDKSQGNSKG